MIDKSFREDENSSFAVETKDDYHDDNYRKEIGNFYQILETNSEFTLYWEFLWCLFSKSHHFNLSEAWVWILTTKVTLKLESGFN